MPSLQATAMARASSPLEGVRAVVGRLSSCTLRLPRSQALLLGEGNGSLGDAAVVTAATILWRLDDSFPEAEALRSLMERVGRDEDERDLSL